jgi:mRNA turnover protein 4
LKDTSKFFMGSNKVMAKALGGPDREHEYKENMRHIGGELKGNVGLLFSNEELDVIQKYVKIETRITRCPAANLPTMI